MSFAKKKSTFKTIPLIVDVFKKFETESDLFCGIFKKLIYWKKRADREKEPRSGQAGYKCSKINVKPQLLSFYKKLTSSNKKL